MENNRIISIGPSEEMPRCFPPGSLDWMVIYYESGSYEGSGIAYAKTLDGKYWEKNLGHCSCNGPWEFDDWEQLDIGDLRIRIGLGKEPKDRTNEELACIETITNLQG